MFVYLSCIGPKPGKVLRAVSEWKLVIEIFHGKVIFTLIINNRRKGGVLFHGENFLSFGANAFPQGRAQK